MERGSSPEWANSLEWDCSQLLFVWHFPSHFGEPGSEKC